MIIIKHKRINEDSGYDNLLLGKNTILQSAQEDDPEMTLHNLKGKGRFFARGKILNMNDIKMIIGACFDDISKNCPSLHNILKKKNIIYTDHPRVRTMSTDGRSIYINPAFVDLLVEENPYGVGAVEFVLTHELLHVLLDHNTKYMIRSGQGFVDHHRANRAMDYEVNYIIEYLLFSRDGDNVFEKGITESLGGCINKEWGDDCKTWEEIYPLVPANKMKPLTKIKMSPEWNKGFIEGYNSYLKELRDQKLIERYVG